MSSFIKNLVVIPARGGSKGIPYKNIKLLAGRPLISYSIDQALQIIDKKFVCVSTDDQQIINVIKEYNDLEVPFLRPADLATDTAATNGVILHALEYYERQGFVFDSIILLQPTSPFRTVEDIINAMELFSNDIDMVVSVKKSKLAAILAEENYDGYINLKLNQKGQRRQDVEELYEINGAIYIINPLSLKQKGLSGFTKNVKYVMAEENSLDVDTPFDWIVAECIMSHINLNS